MRIRSPFRCFLRCRSSFLAEGQRPLRRWRECRGRGRQRIAQVRVIGHRQLDPVVQCAIGRDLTIAQRRSSDVRVIADGLDEQPARFRLIQIDLRENGGEVAFQGSPIGEAVVIDLREVKLTAAPRGMTAAQVFIKIGCTRVANSPSDSDVTSMGGRSAAACSGFGAAAGFGGGVLNAACFQCCISRRVSA